MESAFLLAYILCTEAVPLALFVLMIYIVYSVMVTQRWWNFEKTRVKTRLVEDGIDVDAYYTLFSSRWASLCDFLSSCYDLLLYYYDLLLYYYDLLLSYYDLLLSYYDLLISYYNRIPSFHGLLTLYCASPWLIFKHGFQCSVLCAKAYWACARFLFYLFCLYWRLYLVIPRLAISFVRALFTFVKQLVHVCHECWIVEKALFRLALDCAGLAVTYTCRLFDLPIRVCLGIIAFGEFCKELAVNRIERLFDIYWGFRLHIAQLLEIHTQSGVTWIRFLVYLSWTVCLYTCRASYGCWKFTATSVKFLFQTCRKVHLYTCQLAEICLERIEHWLQLCKLIAEACTVEDTDPATDPAPARHPNVFYARDFAYVRLAVHYLTFPFYLGWVLCREIVPLFLSLVRIVKRIAEALAIEDTDRALPQSSHVIRVVKRLRLSSHQLSAHVIRAVRSIKDARPKMEAKAEELLTVLKNGNLSIDTKVNRLLGVKSDIKQKNVSVHSVPPLFNALQLAIGSPHSQIYGAGFSTLSHLTKRLYIQQQPGEVATQARNLYPVLLERLGDHKERVRALASQAFTDLWPAASNDVERQVLGSALVGKNPRAKETSMAWLANISKTFRILIKAYVPSLVACLEDADSSVRDMAKTTVIELFQNAPAHAKLDLKREIADRHVRKSIANAILTNIGLGSGPERSHTPGPTDGDNITSQPVRPPPMSHESTRTPPINPPRPKSRVDDNIMSQPVRPPPVSHESTGAPPVDPPTSSRPKSREGDSPKPLYVQSARELEDIFRGMLSSFEGRESEQNWGAREKNVNTIRRLAQGNAPIEYTDAYITGVKTVLDGIFKVVNSLRTTPSTNGLLLVQELATICGPKLDGMVEVMMQHLVVLCSGTKKITREVGCEVVDTILGNVTYTSRLLHHVSGACEGKNPWIREYAARWLKTLLNRQGHNKSSIEHNGGLETIEKCIKKGLTDANPGVREVMRSTFWVFSRIWPPRAENIISNLDKRSRQMLEKDPANPNNSGVPTSEPGSPRKGLAKSASASSSRSALKDAIAAQRKAHLAPTKALPPRPGSAQAVLTETNTAKPGPKAVRSVPTGASTSSLSSAPVRPGVRPRRPEVARPATADPFSTSRRPPAAKPTGIRPKKLDLPKANQSDSVAVERIISPEPHIVVPSGPPAAPKPPDVPTEQPVVIISEQPVARPEPYTVVDLPDAPTERLVVGPSEPPAAVEPSVVPTEQTLVRSEPSAAVDLPAAPTEQHVVAPPEQPVVASPDKSVVVPSGPPAASEPLNMFPEQATEQATEQPTEQPIEQPIEKPTEESPEQATEKPVVRSESPAAVLPAVPTERLVAPSEPPAAIEPPVVPTEKPIVDLSEAPASVEQPAVAPEQPSVSLEERTGDQPFEFPLGDRPGSPDFETTADDLALGGNQLPKQRIRRRTHPGELDENDPLTRRWKQAVVVVDKRRNVSSQSQSLPFARDLVNVAHTLIKGGQFDMWGYRKLQGLIVFHNELFVDEKAYSELLQDMLDDLQRYPDHADDPTCMRAAMDHKTQILLTIRCMFVYDERWFADHKKEVIGAILPTRQFFESRYWVVNALNETASDLLYASELSELVDSIMDSLATMNHGDLTYRSMTMGVLLLTRILKIVNSQGVPISDKITTRVGEFAVDTMLRGHLDTRSHIGSLAQEVKNIATNETHFWDLLGAPSNDWVRNMFAYFFHKK